jgi:hypothetical protein
MAHELPQPGEDALPVRYSWLYLRPSSREESHLPAIPDLGATVSRCPTPVTLPAGRSGPAPSGGQQAEKASCRAAIRAWAVRCGQALAPGGGRQRGAVSRARLSVQRETRSLAATAIRGHVHGVVYESFVVVEEMETVTA